MNLRSHGFWRRRTWLIWWLLPVALPIIAIALIHRVLIRRRPFAGLQEKLSGHGPKAKPGAILLHGVSMGEVILMKTVAKGLSAQGHRLIFSTSTVTGREALDAAFPDALRRFLPFDLPWAVDRFFSEVKPAAILLFESEIWPGFLAAAHARRIPVIIVNARMGERSFSRWQHLRFVARPLLEQTQLVLAQNALWGARLKALGAKRVKVSGSMKADLAQAAQPENIAKQQARLGLSAEKPMILLGSTAAPEESLLLPSIFATLPDWTIVLCPRHPERGGELQSMVQGLGRSAVRSSQGPLPITDPSTVRIVDEIGCLTALYALADLAIVGGSLGSGRGGQNCWEAAAAGRIPLVGPDQRNFPDAIAVLQSHNAVVMLSPQDPESMQEIFRDLAQNPAKRQELGQRAQEAWKQSQGSLARTLRLLKNVLRERVSNT